MFTNPCMDDRVYVGIFFMSYYRTAFKNSSKDIGKNKSRSNIYKVRHEYFNARRQESFKVMKKYYFDVAWVYKIRYDNNSEEIVTEDVFTDRVNKGIYQRATTDTAKKVAEAGHFGESELFELT